MTSAAVVYRSPGGITRRYAEEIARYLSSKGIEASVASVGECDPASLVAADYVLLGCWTGGLFVILQHPDEPWLAFVRNLPKLERPRIGLFTTFKLATGSMFPKMAAALAGRAPVVELELRARNGSLSGADRRAIDRFVAKGAVRP